MTKAKRKSKKSPNPKRTGNVEVYTHDESSRKNIPTAEFQSLMHKDEQRPIRVAYQRRNRDLDPQLVWSGKDEQDWSDLIVSAPPLYIQEKVHPKVLIDDLLRRKTQKLPTKADEQLDLFAKFNGLPDDSAKTEFYKHDANWTNRMILGDSMQVMASMAEREGLRGKVQCIYIDPPYGIRFNSNFQWSTTTRDVKDGKVDHITREPEQVKAFRDTWRNGIHSYLTYLRDRLTVSRDLLSDTGSVFVQIGSENEHLVRSLMTEVFGDRNYVATIMFRTTTGFASKFISSVCDYVIWFAKNKDEAKYRQLFVPKTANAESGYGYNKLELKDLRQRKLTNEERADTRTIPEGSRLYRLGDLKSQGISKSDQTFSFRNKKYLPGANAHWKTTVQGMENLSKAGRIQPHGSSIGYMRYFDDFPVSPITNYWHETANSYQEKKTYVVQTLASVIEKCVLMSTDPGDLVLDPTCGSGTTAYVSEQWGRRWITIDTSRVALALARARIMGARYPYYLLSDSSEGQSKEAELKESAPSDAPTYNNIRHGFVYERAPHITLKAIANNPEIGIIWERFQDQLESKRKELCRELKETWEEWEVPRESDGKWSNKAKKVHSEFWSLRVELQSEMDRSISTKADQEFLYDRPYIDAARVRVAGPFTVESISPHREIGIDENDQLLDEKRARSEDTLAYTDFVEMVLNNLKTAGVQQAHKEDKIEFSSIKAWPGRFVCAEGKYLEGVGEQGSEKRAGIFIGPEFGTVMRPDLVSAAREAADADFDILISCAFNYEAHATEFNSLGRVPVLKARMNADLHMSDDLKATGKGNLFVIFGEPDIEILEKSKEEIQVKIKGVDVFHPNTGEVRSDGPEGIACWFIDTDYNEESFFVRQAYFLGATDPYKELRTSLKAEIDKEAWNTLHSDTSRNFPKPKSGRIAVKVINHLGDEVMKVFQVN